MSLTIRYSDPRGISEPAVTVSLGSNVRFGDVGLALSAEAGDVGTSTVDVEDPGGIYTFVGLRALEFAETSAPSNNRIIGRFVMQDREVGRDPDKALITGKDRLWSVDLTDYNWHLGKRILVDHDSDRPAESAGDRLKWLLTNGASSSHAAHITLYDYGNVTYPTAQLDPFNYVGMMAADVLLDCAVEEQFNYWVRYNEGHQTPELFFLNPNSSLYASTIQVSNVRADVDNLVVFYPTKDAKLRRSPSRLAFGVYLPWSDGWTYLRNDVIAQQYAPQDQAAPMVTVRSRSRAERIAQRFLNANNEETDVITWGMKVPAAQVNDILEGHRVAVKFQHLPGYETGVWVRVINRHVLQEEEGGGLYYKIELTAVPSGDSPATIPPVTDFTGNVFAGIQRTQIYGFTVPHYPGFQYSAVTGAPGWQNHATTGPISITETHDPFLNIVAAQDMTVRIYARGEGANAYSPAFLVTFSVTVNGAVIQSDSRYTNVGFDSWNRTVDIRNYHLSAGDVVSVTGTLCEDWGNSGVNHTMLYVGRGSFAMPTPDDPITWTGP